MYLLRIEKHGNLYICKLNMREWQQYISECGSNSMMMIWYIQRQVWRIDKHVVTGLPT